MHHSKALYFTFIMMLISSYCIVSFNNYSILYITHSIITTDLFEKHTMHHSKALYFTFIMMLISSNCTVSFNNYRILYITHYILTTDLFSCYRIIIIFESESFKLCIFKTTK